MGIPDYRDSLLLWLDIETTGLETDAEILEVAWAVERLSDHLADATDPSRAAVLLPTSRYAAGSTVAHLVEDGVMLPEVRLMHETSGLLDCLRRDESWAGAGRVPVDEIVSDIVDDVQWHLGITGGISRVIMAGSGVCAYEGRLLYDRPEWGPLLRRLDHGWWDVGSMRRMARACGVDLGRGPVRHRAAADLVQAHAESVAICALLADAAQVTA